MWPDLLVEALRLRGNAGPTDLATWMTEVDRPTTRQAVDGWLRGGRPDPWRWAALFDALKLTTVERAAWEQVLRSPPTVRVTS